MKVVAKTMPLGKKSIDTINFTSSTMKQILVGMDNYHLCDGAEYAVHAMSVFDGVTFLLVIDDTDTAAFVPCWRFDVVDSSVPLDWVCSVNLGGGVDLVVGPSFMAKDLDSYMSMVDRAYESISAFWDRIEKRERVTEGGGVPAERKGTTKT